MTKASRPKHNYPIKHVGISDSHNVYKTQKRIDIKEANSLMHYHKNGLMPSLKFKRVSDSILNGFDENKTEFPLYGKVRLSDITIISSLEHGMYTSVLGTKNTGNHLEKIKDYYKSINMHETAERLKWVPELDDIDNPELDDKSITAENRKKLTLSNSLKRIAASFNLDKNDAFMFVAGDIMFYDYPIAAQDYDYIYNSLVVDFNAKEVINPPFPRNYYHRLITGQGDVVHFKEPNVWTFGSEFNLGLSTEAHANAQKGGFGIKAFLKMASKNMLKNPHKVTLRDLWVPITAGFEESLGYISRKSGFKPYIPQYYQEDLESLGKFLNMSPIRIKAEHNDSLRIKDVDDLLSDYPWARRILERHIDDILPEKIANRIKGLADYLEEFEPDDNPSEFPERMNSKIRRIQFILNKKKFDYKLEMPFDGNGEFVAEPREDENLEEAAEKAKIYREGYYQRQG